MKHALAEYRGSTIVLEWTNHECPYTAKHYRAGAMQALQEQATVDMAARSSMQTDAGGAVVGGWRKTLP
jgi:hypothetical protein